MVEFDVERSIQVLGFMLSQIQDDSMEILWQQSWNRRYNHQAKGTFLVSHLTEDSMIQLRVSETSLYRVIIPSMNLTVISFNRMSNPRFIIIFKTKRFS